MATYEYSDKVKFVLPAGFVFSREDDGEGDEIIKISAGEYENDDGEKQYKFNARLLGILLDPEVEPDEDEDAVNCDNFLDKTSKQLENSKRLRISTNPDAYYINKNTPMTFFGIKIKAFSTMLMARVSDYELIDIVATSVFNDEDDSENDAVYENMFEILKAIRINNKKLQLENVTPHYLRSAVQLSFDEENSEAIDISPKISLAIGNQKAVYEYSEGNINEISKSQLNYAEPDNALYPHYNSKLSASGLGSFLGVQVVVNASGTEYEFISLDRLADDDEIDEEQRSLYQRIIAKDTEVYSLDQKAKALQKLFRVSEDVFDCNHDRECEIEQGYLHRAYMFSALRSFSWTLTDLCQQTGCTPENIDLSDIKRIVSFIADNDWLNYDDKTHCKGLCSGSDLHVFYIPDSVSKADKQELMPSQEDFDRVKAMKERFPNYREILSEVHSLNELRKDLSYIYPAIETLWKELAESRDYDKPLTGNEADIVYAWCSLARAAKKPFFTEDGPMRCFFSQIDTRNDFLADISESKADVVEYTAKIPSAIYGDIDWDEYDEADESDFVDSDHCSLLEKYIGNDKIVIIPSVIFDEIDYDAFEGCSGVEGIYVPNGIKEISGSAFSKCKNLRQIRLPEDLETISFYLFSDCTNLEKVIVPNSVTKIESSAFSGCSKLEYVFIPSTVTEIEPGILNGSPAFICSDTTDCYAKKYADANEIVFKVRNDDGTFTTIKSDIQKVEYKPKKAKGSSKTYVIEDTTLVKYNGKAWQPEMPPEITAIGEGAFAENKSVRDIIIRKGVTRIEDFIIYGCEGITLTIAPTVTYIGENVISSAKECRSVKVVEGSYADEFFKNYKYKLSISYIDANKTNQLSKEKVTFTKEDKKLFDISGTEINSYKGKDPHVVIPEGITEIKYGAFHDRTDIESVVFPDSVLIIGDRAFEGCTGLQSIELPKHISQISSYLFEDCTGLKSIKMHNEVTIIGDNAFKGCSGLEKVVIPESVKKIGDHAFADCSELKEVNIPANVTNIGSFAFHSCKSLTRIHIPDTVNEIGLCAFSFCENLSEVNIPKSVSIIEDLTFSGTKIRNLEIPDNVVKIGASAFSSCKELEGVKISASVTMIGERAFAECENLKNLVIPDNVKDIGEKAFEKCYKLADDQGFVIIAGILYAYCGKATTVQIPECVTKIENWVFEKDKDLKQITIPDSVTEIGSIYSDIQKNLTICAPAGCFAEKFAEKNNIKFEAYLTEEQKEAIRREEEAKRLAEEKARKEAEERRLREEEERRIAEEQRLAEQKRISEQRKAEYDALVEEKEQLLQTIAENKGLFGEKARRRKEAKQRLEEVEIKLAAYPEFAQ